MNKFCSIIITHFAMNEERSQLMRESIQSLVDNTDYPYELIIVDNGGSESDSQWLVNKADRGEIHVYVRNAQNMHFGFARNQGIALSHGNYICIADNDILYKPNWLNKCVKILEDEPKRKIYSTPFSYPTPVMSMRYHMGWVKKEDGDYELNMRAGSNCFVIRKEDFMDIGLFDNHRIAGSKWTDRAVGKGYLACVLPGVYAVDAGLRRGYQLSSYPPVELKMKGLKVYFNQDEFKRENPDNIYL